MFQWPVVPICERQRRDCRSVDILERGMYRLCDVSRAGGGIDPLPALIAERLGWQDFNLQFVVQLYGCPLNCSYCYVTRDGVFGNAVPRTTDQLVEAFRRTDADVFHLMGGSPSIYLEHWPEFLGRVNVIDVFHSDILLVDHLYCPEEIKEICVKNALYAVNIKGMGASFTRMTGVPWLNVENLFWNNLAMISKFGDPQNFYLTYTGLSDDEVERIDYIISSQGLCEGWPRFRIPIRKYKALEN